MQLKTRTDVLRTVLGSIRNLDEVRNKASALSNAKGKKSDQQTTNTSVPFQQYKVKVAELVGAD